MKRIFTASNIAEAGLMRSYLEQHDIPSILRNEHTSGVIGDLPFVDNSPELWVDVAFAHRALKLVEEARRTPDQESPEWTCLSCKELNPGNFELCWGCAEPFSR